MLSAEKTGLYNQIVPRINALIDCETDIIAVMSTVVCELHQSIAYFDWTGFYRLTQPQLLTVGPYQGAHGCLRIPLDKGICGRSARTKTTVIIDDVARHGDHIACSATTVSEIVVPLLDQQNRLIAVLDVDSNLPAAFDSIDKTYLETICSNISKTLYSR